MATRTVTEFSAQPTRDQGFSLLELMVVVALVGLAAAMIIPNLAGPDADALQDAEDRLRSRISVLADRSLVRGELLAVRLKENRAEFLRYDFTEGAFVPLGTDEQSGVTFDEPVRLEWRLQDNDSRDGHQQGPDLASVVEQRLAEDMEDADADANEDDSGDGQDSDDAPFPQLFFFPSGEATPATLWLRNADAEQQVTLELDSLGRIRRPQGEGDGNNGDGK